MPGWSRKRRGRNHLLAKGSALAAFVAAGWFLLHTGGRPVQAAPQRPTVSPLPGKKAFPGAIGFGAIAKGGRDGTIMMVTNLDDSGKGSLRACIEAKGPRVCVFRVNGLIRFSERPPVIRNPYLTIAGQTAPGSGITIAHSGGANGRTPLVIKNTHDVVVRHIRIRPDRPGGNRGAEDTITIENSSNVIIDHVSASWARDELINGYGDNDSITVSNSIFAWGIPSHDKCALLASDPKEGQRFSFINNVCAHNGDRNPDLNFPPHSCVEVVNNVLYNGASRFAEIWESFGGTPVSIVGNTFVSGPNTASQAVGIARDTRYSTGKARIYLWDNRFQGGFEQVNSAVREVQEATPICALTLQPLDSRTAYARTLERAGAFPRDTIDDQVIYDVKHGSGRIGQPDPKLPSWKRETPDADSDLDGMSDGWERMVGTNPQRGDPWGDIDGDGVENLEEFLSYREMERGL